MPQCDAPSSEWTSSLSIHRNEELTADIRPAGTVAGAESCKNLRQGKSADIGVRAAVRRVRDGADTLW